MSTGTTSGRDPEVDHTDPMLATPGFPLPAELRTIIDDENDRVAIYDGADMDMEQAIGVPRRLVVDLMEVR